MNDARAIPASTLVVVRDEASTPPQLLMVERAQSMAFAGGALVFPGGRIDEEDRQIGAAIGDPDGGARVAAIRETLEETAIPVGLEPLPTPEQAQGLQHELLAGQSFEVLLADAGLTLDLSQCVPLARWIPKFHASRRFDTLFFVSRAPQGDWQPNTVARECTGAEWVTAEDVLGRDRAGTAQLIFPTRRTLERLAQHADFTAIEADARSFPIEPITPWVEEVGGERYVTIPSEIGYPVTRERLDNLWRG